MAYSVMLGKVGSAVYDGRTYQCEENNIISLAQCWSFLFSVEDSTSATEISSTLSKVLTTTAVNVASSTATSIGPTTSIAASATTTTGALFYKIIKYYLQSNSTIT